MEIYKTRKDVNRRINELKAQGKTIGFVPTMGALHEGHLSLIRCSKKDNDITAVSIFVNPTQFNDPKDLERYPRMLDKDIEKLEAENVDILFAPDEKEMYPEPDTRKFDFGHLDKILEGKYRPGHFNGVAQIVSKLFETIPAHRAYFGKKDYQQYLIIKALVAKYMPDLDIEIIPCPIIREKDGLAMSSRNLLLTPEQRKSAKLISQILFRAKDLVNVFSVPELKQFVIDTINQDPNLKVEYFEIADADTLMPIEDWSETHKPIALIAVYDGEIRLIDNIELY